MTDPDAITAALAAQVLPVLERSRELGFLGPGPIERHLQHALGFRRAIRWALARTAPLSTGTAAASIVPAPPPSDDDPLDGALVDLGSGGGVPGLVLAAVEPGLRVTLVDANARRCELLEDGARLLGMSGRLSVVLERAELVGRDATYRAQFSFATARSFGPPGVTAECAAPLLRVGGVLVTSEPPADSGAISSPETTSVGALDRSSRWPADGLTRVGMQSLGPYPDQFTYQVVVQAAPCPERYPRRVGVPTKRPLF